MLLVSLALHLIVEAYARTEKNASPLPLTNQRLAPFDPKAVIEQCSAHAFDESADMWIVNLRCPMFDVLPGQQQLPFIRAWPPLI